MVMKLENISFVKFCMTQCKYKEQISVLYLLVIYYKTNAFSNIRVSERI